MLAIAILLSACYSACLSQQLTLPAKVIIHPGDCVFVRPIYSNMPKNISLVFSYWPKELEIFDWSQKIKISYNYKSTLKPKTKQQETQYFMFCLQPNTKTVQQFNVIYYFMNDQINYTQQVKPIVVYSVQQLQNIQIPAILWKSESIKGSCAEFNVVTPGIDGIIYYSISNNWTLEHPEVKYRFSDCKQFGWGCSNLITYPVYNNLHLRQSRNVIIQKKRVSTNQTKIIIKHDLMQGQVYKICAFYQNNELNNNKISCKYFKTDTSQNMLRAHFKFTQKISLFRLNAFLCFLTTYLDVHLKDLITIDCLSCSINSPTSFQYPVEYYYEILWTKQTKTIRYGNQTIIYIDQGCSKNKNLDFNFNQIWNIHGNMSSSFRSLLNSYDLTWVKDSKNLGQKNVREMLYPNECFNVQFLKRKTKRVVANTPVTYLRMQNITSSSGYGSVYFMYLIFNTQAGPQPFIPNKTQTLSCLLYQRTFPQPECQRVFFTGSTSQPPTVQFFIPINLNSSQYIHKIFYVEVSQYPKFPTPCPSQVREIIFEGEKSLQDGKAKETKKETENEKEQEEVKKPQATQVGKRCGGVIMAVGIIWLGFVMM